MSRTALSIVAILSGLAACLVGGAAEAGGNLYIYNWTDYTAPDLIAKFEKETGVKVTVDTYDSNETLLAKLKSGATGYDIVVASSDFVPILIDQKLIQSVDASKLPGWDNIEPRWRRPPWDPTGAYTIPFDWGVTSFAVNTKFVKEPADSLKLFFQPPPEAQGKVGAFGSASEVISLAEVYLGLPPCQTDVANMKKVYQLLERQAPDVKVYNSDGIIERLASNDTWLNEVWNGDAARARANNPDVHFVFPKEGVVGWMDNMAVPTTAKDVDNAKLFMAFMLRPENAAMSSNFTHYASAISGVGPYLSPQMRDAPELHLPPNLKIAFTPTCPEPAIRLMDKVWTQLRR